jgi:outer membrane receptor protein involved in Fe transport
MSTSKYNAQPAVPVKSTLAVAISMALTGQTETAQAQDGEHVGLEEITVTARKREQSLQDVSASVQAITGEDLKRQGLANMEDVIRFLPSVSHIGGTAGANKIIFRGVSDNPNAFIAASSSALFLDEQPLTQFAVNPEPRMIDIERVEALAGPQGTLYGDSSQSGTLRIITNKPDPSAFSAFGDVMYRTGEESDASYEVSGMLNLPLIEDKFALRLVGFSATDGGFIDNVLGVSPMKAGFDNASVVEENINGVDSVGGRVSAKWFINDDWSVYGAAIYQNSEAQNRNDYDPGVGDLKTVKFFNDVRDDTWSQLALTIEGEFGDGFEFVSSTSYFDRDVDYIYDRTTYAAYFNVNFCEYAFFPGYCWSGQTFYDQDTVARNTYIQENTRFTQEFRLSHSTDNTRWVVGAFYEEKTEYWEYRAQTNQFLTSPLVVYYWTSSTYSGNTYTFDGSDPSFWLSADDTDWEQWAVFGNFSMDFNDHWSAEIGLRYFDQTMDKTYLVGKPFLTDAPAWPDVVQPTGGNSSTVPKVSLTYRIDDEKLVYGLYSEGWRAGGVNRNRTPFTVFPSSYEPDKLKNLEFGTKTRWADGRVQVNATVFFMQWEDYQIEVVDPSFQPCGPGEIPDVDFCDQPFQVLVGNVGDAEQFGVEFDFRAVAGDNLDLGLNLTYLDAKTSEDFTVTLDVPKGTGLPNVPDWKLNTFAQYNWPVSFVSDGSMYARLQYSYQSESDNQLEPFPEVAPGEANNLPKRVQPSYGIADFSVGLSGRNWLLMAFVNNLGDERAVLFDNVLFHDTFFGRNRINTNRPREYGVRFRMNWGD